MNRKQFLQTGLLGILTLVVAPVKKWLARFGQPKHSGYRVILPTNDPRDGLYYQSYRIHWPKNVATIKYDTPSAWDKAKETSTQLIHDGKQWQIQVSE